MSDTAEEYVQKNIHDINAAVPGHKHNTKCEGDFIEFSADEECNDQVFISVPNVTRPIEDNILLRANKKSRRVSNHPLANVCTQDHPLLARTSQRSVRTKIRNRVLTREKRINNRFMVNSKDTWTGQERSNLINALKKHGIFDVCNLHKAVPTKSKSQILEFVKAAQTITQNTLDDRIKEKDSSTEQDNPIAQWLNAMEASATEQKDRLSAYNLMLPKVFLYISKYGNHPDPAICGGINYRDAYEYIYHMLSGQPGKHLMPETARFVKKTLLDLSLHARNGSGKHLDFIRSLQVTSTGFAQMPNYGTAKETSRPSSCKTLPDTLQQNALQEILKISAANPLKVPMKILEFE